MGIFDLGDKRPRRARMGLNIARKRLSYYIMQIKIRVYVPRDDDYIIYVFEKLGHSWNIVFPLFSPVEIPAIILMRRIILVVLNTRISLHYYYYLGSPFLHATLMLFYYIPARMRIIL